MTKAHEFGGPVGTFLTTVSLPFVIYGLYFLCDGDFCVSFDWKKELNWASVWERFTTEPLVDWTGASIFLGWMAFHVILERLLPGESVEGAPLPDGSGRRLSYRISGHLQFWVTFILMGHAVPIITGVDWSSLKDWDSIANAVISLKGFHPLPLHMVYDHYLSLITTAIIFTFAMSMYLYIGSFYPPNKVLAKGGNTGYPTYDFFMGRELNPRIGSLDLKEFCELRPGLIGWAVLNLGMAVKQYQKHGAISLSMLLVNLLQGQYVWDALYNEKSILTTMDITTDGFGFMLCFGDLAWVPFVYSFHSRYLVDHDPHLGLGMIALALAVFSLGFYIFRAANSEKDAFRRDPTAPEVKHLRYMPTKRGTKLLVSGWWGAARKINYTGDWLVTLSWCLLCGFDSPLIFFQAVYFLILLVHRAMRDDEMCAEKYGADWVAYKKEVPYLFIPYVI